MLLALTTFQGTLLTVFIILALMAFGCIVITDDTDWFN